MENVLTVKEVANHLKIKELTVKTYIYQGRLVAFKLGKEWRITEDDLERFIESFKIDSLRISMEGVFTEDEKQAVLIDDNPIEKYYEIFRTKDPKLLSKIRTKYIKSIPNKK